MSRYSFDLATRADDAELRQILARTPMDGDISVSFRREPDFFAAAPLGGPFSQTVIGRDGAQNRIVGFGVRSCREMYVNGLRIPIGYLSSLRVLSEYRNLGLVARGYAYFHELHADGRTKLYLTTIADGNDRALQIVTSGRAGLPGYYFAGRYLTLAIPLSGRRINGHSQCDVHIRPSTVQDVPELCDFLTTHGPRRQFFPCYGEHDFFRPDGTFLDLRPEDLLLALRDNRIVGTIGVWNQSGFRQSVVERYSTRLRWAKPFYNGWSRLRGRPALPPVGEPFRYAVAAVPVVADDDLTVCEALLDAAVERAGAGTIGHLLIGLHETDPLVPAARNRSRAAYVTQMFHVCWDDGNALRMSLDERTPYLELGTL
jgi:hypothetical protein